MPALKLSLARLPYGLLSTLVCLLLILPVAYPSLPARADGLSGRSLQLLDSSPGATTSYTVSLTINTNSTIGSLDILLCSNSPLPDDSCTLPAGLDVTGAILSSQSGITDFTLFAPATNQLVLSRTPSVIAPPLSVTLTFTNVINPSNKGPYYARLATYSSNNVTGPVVDFGGLAFAITSNLLITSVVPPYILFCSGIIITGFDCSSANGNYIDFGNLSSTSSKQAASLLLIATNAANGYTIQVNGTTMIAGNNVIPALAGDTASQPGTSQFGINLRANVVPAIGADPSGPGSGQPAAPYNNPDLFRFVNDDTIASSLNADNYRKYTVSYIVNANKNQAPGVYVSTLTYVAAGSF